MPEISCFVKVLGSIILVTVTAVVNGRYCGQIRWEELYSWWKSQGTYVHSRFYM